MTLSTSKEKPLPQEPQIQSRDGRYHGILHYTKQELGKNPKFLPSWVEVDVTSEIVHIFDIQDRRKTNLIDWVNLDTARVRGDFKKNKWLISIREKAGKRHQFTASSQEERDSWIEIFNKSIKFFTDINERQTTEQTTLRQTEPYSRSLDILTEIKQHEEFWPCLLRDINNQQISLEEIVGTQPTLILLLRNFGSCFRTACTKILSKKEELQELGLQLVAIGGGHPLVAKLVVQKEPGMSGLHIYTDTMLEHIYSLFAKRFAGPNLEQLTQTYGIFVLTQHGTILRWFSQDFLQSLDPQEIISSLERFYMIHGDECWTHKKIPKAKWKHLRQPGTELPQNIVVDRSTGYEYEYGTNMPPPGTVDLIDDLCPYKDYFHDIDHTVVVCEDEDMGPLILCLDTHELSKGTNCRALILQKKMVTRATIPFEQCKTVKDMVAYLGTKVMEKPLVEFNKMKFTWIDHEEIKDDLLLLEKKIHFNQYKFGVLYAKSGKIEEDEMYQNSDIPQDLTEFLEWLGDKIALSGWKKFKGGLDVRGSDLTGTHSFYTEFKGQEIMFHVGPMMPSKDNDPSRKRYIGNDVVVIIFKESNNTDRFSPHVIRSQYNHVFAVVEKVQGPKGPAYRIEISQKPSVPPYPPYLPDPPIFAVHDQDSRNETRDFFLTKLINAERVTISNVPIFRANMATTREALISDLVKQHLTKKAMEKKKPATLPLTVRKTTDPDDLIVSLKERPKDRPLEDAINYDQLEEAVLVYLCREKNLPFENSKQAFEQLAQVFFGSQGN